MRKLALLLLLSVSGCCAGDLNCQYASMTIDGIQHFCREHGGAGNIQWNDQTAECKDGTIYSVDQGYTKHINKYGEPVK